MKSAAEMFPQNDDYFYVGDYTPIIEAIGTVAIRKDQDDYQGDTWVLYDNGGTYGYLCFGWGSCSGCDALQACDSLADVDKLAAEIADKVRWFDDRTDALKFFREHDWEGDWDHDAEFVAKAMEYLGATE